MSSSIDPYAELASLFLTDDPESPSSIPIKGPRPTMAATAGSDTGPIAGKPEAHRATTIRLDDDGEIRFERGVGSPVEIALVGHLPVMGGLWLTQYADSVARREGPTALVRLERGQVTLELLRDPRHRTLLDAVTTAEQAIAELTTAAKRWIVCPGSEAALDGPLPGDALSLLTGGDDAATVAAYRIMKNLAERWHAAHWPVPPIGLVVFGASPDRVDEVAEKLDRTTKAFLDVDLAVIGQQQRMDTIESACRRTFQGVELSVNDVIRRIRQPRESRYAAFAESPAAEPRSDVRDPLAATMSKLAPKPAPRTVGRPVDMPVDTDHAADHHSHRLPLDAPPPLPTATHATYAEEIATEIKPAAHAGPVLTYIAPPADPMDSVERTSPSHAVASREVRTAPAPFAPSGFASTGIASLIPGLVTLPLRAPNHPEVDLARDESGRLHLVVVDHHLAALRPAEAWAHAHLDLLRVAFPELVVSDEPIVRDVVTYDAPSIIPLHGTGLRLHLMVDGPSGTMHVSLNRG
ncbi:MAG: hypothetical protein JNL80_15620 [Phycisphaerae bacterium]|nr:hypothetical protein [Phycisphaerae bacterium]